MYKKIPIIAMTLALAAAPVFAQPRPTVEQVRQQLADTAPAEAQQHQFPDAKPFPTQLTIKAGTYITVRLNEILSSDRSMVGDAFTASLAKPIVVDGIVVAQRGQDVTGRVTEAKKRPDASRAPRDSVSN